VHTAGTPTAERSCSASAPDLVVLDYAPAGAARARPRHTPDLGRAILMLSEGVTRSIAFWPRVRAETRHEAVLPRELVSRVKRSCAGRGAARTGANGRRRSRDRRTFSPVF